ncbi:MAG TPA: hypothetical protein VHV54_20830 [Candidatus Binatia bacterium]|nr:hypothetical protein [Candidatus Binatia bacterium]
MKSPNCVAIMALLNEMVRRVNENISKVELKPLNEAFSATVNTKRLVRKAAKA